MLRCFKYTARILPASIVSIYWDEKPFQTVPADLSSLMHLPKIADVAPSLMWKIRRFFKLLWIFLPSIITLPLLVWRGTRKVWLRMFVDGIAKAGPVWIKGFQYLSHRPDLVSEGLAEALKQLRDNCPLHSNKETQKIINQRIHHSTVSSKLEGLQLAPEPIASGSISQVYKGILNGKAVAVKVRHPTLKRENIIGDIDLLLGITGWLSKLTKELEFPITK